MVVRLVTRGGRATSSRQFWVDCRQWFETRHCDLEARKLFLDGAYAYLLAIVYPSRCR